jgi:hypothetical protein
MTNNLEISVKELTETYPVNSNSIAGYMGVTKSYLHLIFHNKVAKRPEIMRKHYLNIQNALRKGALDMKAIALTKTNFSETLKSLPLSTTALSLYMGENRFWIDDMLHLPHTRLKTDFIARIEAEIKDIGEKLSGITLTDFIEHDEVAQYLINIESGFSLKSVKQKKIKIKIPKLIFERPKIPKYRKPRKI